MRAGGASRRWRFALLVVAVAALHLALTRELAEGFADSDPSQAMPARLQVAYTRTIELAAPPALPPPRAAAPAAAAAPRSVAAKAVKTAASAAEAKAKARAEPDAEAADGATAAAPSPAPVADTTPPAGEAAPVASADAASEPADATADVARAVADAASHATGAAFAWPASTRVTYTLTGNYRGEVSGEAQVEWVRLGERYQVHLDLRVGPEFAPLIARRMTSEGRIESEGLAPERYEEDTRVVFRDRRRASVAFEPDAVVLANGQRAERLPGVQDTASQFIQMTYLFTTRPELLRVGGSVEVPLALPRRMDRWTYDVIDEQTLSTLFGDVDTFHLKPRRIVRKTNELTAEIWFAPELRYLPVRIRIEQDAQTFIDLMIVRKPETAAS